VGSSNNVISIGSPGDDVDNSTWINNIYGVTTQSGTTAAVIVSDAGQLGTVASAQRFKKDIASMDKASEVILSLRPVTFHYKTDAKRTPQFGLIAEEVANVSPALVVPDKEGKPYSVRYDQVNAMLLNEFLKAHRKVEEQETTIAQLKKQVETLVAHSQEQDSQIQRISEQAEMGGMAHYAVATEP
jgi:predicted ribosome quality control (RQC) complex YloA/Tae2 family protein